MTPRQAALAAVPALAEANQASPSARPAASHNAVSSAPHPGAGAATLHYMPAEHEPVLLTETVDLLDPQEGETAIDLTFGGGGHACAVAERLGATGRLICIDRDPVIEERFKALAGDLGCETRFIRAEYSDALAGLLAEGIRADLVYMDLGMSSIQLDNWERGFSYAYDAPLDMRMDPTQEISAKDVINEWPQTRLAKAIREFGEERRAGSIAREIVKRRPIETTSELVEAIKAGVPPADRFGRGHPAKRAFQAIRIAVNGELDALSRALPLAWELLDHGGRLGAISFHSLEDRRVKRFMAERARGCVCPPDLPVCACGREPEAELVTKRAVSAGDEEKERNPRSGSAHLRVAMKVSDGVAAQ